MNILRNVTLTKANRKVDKSISLSFTTCLEETSEDFIEVDKLIGQSGLVYFKPSGTLTDKEKKAIDSNTIEVEGKSKSKRLMNVLYVLHKETQDERDFEDYYAQKMESLINHFKDQIPTP
tara:strand:- start:290 stop:649 length:360 start_codon:yes stop_codon:yes gene_type:complete